MNAPDIAIMDSSPDDEIIERWETGLDTERKDEEMDPITDPFDPEQIKIRTTPILIAQLVSRIRFGEIELTPEFQRLRGIWDIERKSRLVESILLRIPIPVFYVAAQESDNWSVVDGLQRMSTIDDYVNGRFALANLQYLSQLDHLKHDQLPRPMQRRISETQLLVNVIDPGTPDDVMFNVFLRINTGGMTLNRQEIRHAMNRGAARVFLKELAESNEFIEATGGSVKPKRMADRECVLRFLAFHISPPEDYSNTDLDTYLSSAMKKINNMTSDERADIARDFKRAMTAAYLIFEQNAFRKPGSGSRNPVSRALFEVWSVQLARYSAEQIEVLVARREEIIGRFAELMSEDGDFERAITYSTGSTRQVQKRFSEIRRLVAEFV